jgi:hypothetical protein
LESPEIGELATMSANPLTQLIGLANLTYNMKRAVWLTTTTATA